MSNAKELKTLPVTEFPVDLIGTLIERYKVHKTNRNRREENQKYALAVESGLHAQTIREVLAVFGIDPDN